MSSRTDQVPLLVIAMSSAESTTRSVTPTTPTPQSIQSSSLSPPPIDKKRTTRPKIRGSMANLLRRKCLVRSLHSMESVVRPKVFLMDDNDDNDEDTALLTDSSSRTTSSSYDLDYTENDRFIR